MRQGDAYVVGMDFGTDSVRVVVVDAADGAVAGAGVAPYPRWSAGRYCDPLANRFRQHPLDHLEAMEAAARAALRQAGAAAGRVRGVAVDTTGSTPALADAQGRPLALCPGFEEDPDAMFVLWKDHTAVAEAERINALARSWGGVDFTRFEGGVYSSEWFWAKVLHLLAAPGAAPTLLRAAATVVEHCDWVPAVLTGNRDLRALRRSRCAAGHKAMWHAGWGGYPAEEFLARLHPRLPALAGTLGAETWTADAPAGRLAPEWAERLGLPAGVPVAVGAFDAHMGAVGGGIRPHWLLKIMGTSTCDVLVGPREEEERLVPGICGQVDGSVLPGMIGYEAGQSAFGDVYAWFKGVLAWPLHAALPEAPGADEATRRALAQAAADRILPALERAALALPPAADEHPLLAVDWLNGRRTPDANQRLHGAVTGLTLGTDAPRLYRALVEATAYGARAIVERFRSHGLRIDGAIAIGGVAQKSPFVMQTVADAMDLVVEVPAGDQCVALGAAMFAATAAGLYPRVEEAQAALQPPIERTYRPDPAQARRHAARFGDYARLGIFVEQELSR